MALKSTIYKAHLQIADMNRHYYQDHSLTLARHPSETENRLMLRLLAFALYANENLKFTKGLCADDEPELWQINPDQSINLWIDLGTPDLKRLKKACSRSKQVVLLSYGENAVAQWWPSLQHQASELNNLAVISIRDDEAEALAPLAQRGMQISFTIQDETIMVANGSTSLELTPVYLQPYTH